VRTRRAPQRTCIACRTKTDKSLLVRVVRGPSGAVAPDPTGKAPGRGAYLCAAAKCWETGLEKGRLSRALRLDAGLSGDAKSALMAYAEARFDRRAPENGS